VRILIWHGYLLGGTGSNVYTRSLARAWSRLGHEVVVLCQEPHPERFDLGGARVVRPPLSGPLPVFVLDRYAEARPQLLQQMSRADRDLFVAENAAAVRAELPADLLLVNHVLLGGPVGAASGLPYVVKAHGSELEFSMRGDAALAAWGRAALEPARAVLAGSEHIVGVLDEVVGPVAAPVVVVSPGVDIEVLRPQDRAAALAALVQECAGDRPDPDGDGRGPDAGNAIRLAEFLAGQARTVVYVGKLSAEKGVALLIEALRGIDARAVVVGFGPARAELEALAAEDPAAGQRVLFTGALEHRHLAHLWALADVSVTPSLFPEAFGMVAAEAAACGSPPLVARHSGLAEIAGALEQHYPAACRHLASFARGDVDDLRAKLTELLTLPRQEWLAVSRAARRTAVEQWSWEGIAARILAVAG
jgi:glycosyltransferase involved in cell wall biosynthesis